MPQEHASAPRHERTARLLADYSAHLARAGRANTAYEQAARSFLRRWPDPQLWAARPLRRRLEEGAQTRPFLMFSYGTACQAPRIACATADSGRGGPKARRTNRTEQSSGSPPG
jgi:hypothetical protein